MMSYLLICKHFPLSPMHLYYKLNFKKKQHFLPILVWKLTVLGKTKCVGECIRQSADKEHLSSAKPLTLMNSWTAGFSSQG